MYSRYREEPRRRYLDTYNDAGPREKGIQKLQTHARQKTEDMDTCVRLRTCGDRPFWASMTDDALEEDVSRVTRVQRRKFTDSVSRCGREDRKVVV